MEYGIYMQVVILETDRRRKMEYWYVDASRDVGRIGDKMECIRAMKTNCPQKKSDLGNAVLVERRCEKDTGSARTYQKGILLCILDDATL